MQTITLKIEHPDHTVTRVPFSSVVAAQYKLEKYEITELERGQHVWNCDTGDFFFLEFK